MCTPKRPGPADSPAMGTWGEIPNGSRSDTSMLFHQTPLRIYTWLLPPRTPSPVENSLVETSSESTSLFLLSPTWAVFDPHLLYLDYVSRAAGCLLLLQGTLLHQYAKHATQTPQAFSCIPLPSDAVSPLPLLRSIPQCY